MAALYMTLQYQYTDASCKSGNAESSRSDGTGFQSAAGAKVAPVNINHFTKSASQEAINGICQLFLQYLTEDINAADNLRAVEEATFKSGSCASAPATVTDGGAATATAAHAATGSATPGTASVSTPYTPGYAYDADDGDGMIVLDADGFDTPSMGAGNVRAAGGGAGAGASSSSAAASFLQGSRRASPLAPNSTHLPTTAAGAAGGAASLQTSKSAGGQWKSEEMMSPPLPTASPSAPQLSIMDPPAPAAVLNQHAVPAVVMAQPLSQLGAQVGMQMDSVQDDVMDDDDLAPTLGGAVGVVALATTASTTTMQTSFEPAAAAPYEAGEVTDAQQAASDAMIAAAVAQQGEQL